MAPGFWTTSEALSHARLSILTAVTSPGKPIHGPRDCALLNFRVARDTRRIGSHDTESNQSNFSQGDSWGVSRICLSCNSANQACGGLLRMCYPSTAGSLPHVFV